MIDEHFEIHRRLFVLRCLDERGPINTAVLCDLTHAGVAPTTRSQMNTTVAWLEEQGFVRVSELTANIRVVTITQRGQEIAQGSARHPEVRRPSPR